jgi:hypothetical protein
MINRDWTKRAVDGNVTEHGKEAPEQVCKCVGEVSSARSSDLYRATHPLLRLEAAFLLRFKYGNGAGVPF